MNLNVISVVPSAEQIAARTKLLDMAATLEPMQLEKHTEKPADISNEKK
jgi:hypothetical protein